MSAQKEEEDDLPPGRAQAQARRERELRDLLGVAQLNERDRVAREIETLERILRSNRAAIRRRTLDARNLALLQRQVVLREGQLKLLRERLASL